MFFAICLILLCGCGSREPDTASAFALDTLVSVSVYDGTDASEYIDKICGYEKLFSKTVEASDISRINEAGGERVKVSPDTIELLKRCAYYYEISDGRIDPTIGGVSTLWDFHGEGKVPDPEDIKEALGHVGYDKLEIDDESVKLTDPETRLDPGFIAKGYIASKLMEYGEGPMLLNLGGNVSVRDEKPGGDGFKIGIEKPFSDGEPLVTMEISGRLHVVTSGSYERYFEEDGMLYHHILDAKTGYPVENELRSVTIVTDDGIAADALSTTCFVLGMEEGMKMIEDTPGTEALFIDKNTNIYTSSGFPEYRLYKR